MKVDLTHKIMSGPENVRSGVVQNMQTLLTGIQVRKRKETVDHAHVRKMPCNARNLRGSPTPLHHRPTFSFPGCRLRAG